MWEITDPDNNQFCYEVNPFTYHYIEFDNKDIEAYYLLKVLNKNSYFDIEDKLEDENFEFTSAIIDINDYSDIEIREYIESFYDYEFFMDFPEKNQLIAECIFETDYLL